MSRLMNYIQQQLFQPPGAARATAPTTSDVQPNRNPLGVWPGGDWPGQDPVVVRIAAQLSSTLAKNAKWLSLSLSHSLKIKLFSPAARFMLMSLALLFLRWPCGPPSLQITQKLCYIVWDNEAYRFGHVTGALPSSHAEGRSRPACRS